MNVGRKFSSTYSRHFSTRYRRHSMEYTEQELRDILTAAGYAAERIDYYVEQAIDYGDPFEYNDEEHIRQDMELFIRHSED
jgi:plasmid stability protein